MPKLTFNGARFELSCSKPEYAIAKEQGFHWDYSSRVAWTGIITLAKMYEKFADSKAKERFDREKTAITHSHALDANINIPTPPGLSYLPFQKAGVAFALSRKNTLIADEMGLGKTIQAIGVINYEQAIKKVLIITPASLRLNWGNEVQKWMTRKMSGGFVFGDSFPNTDIVIINYDIVKKHRAEIDRHRWDLVVCDESHYIKNQDAQRTKAVVGGESYGKVIGMPIDAGMRINLTGTPILNRPIELWTTVRLFDPEGLGASYWAFAKKYCKAWDAPWGWDFSGHDHLEELQERLRASIMIRRLKRDVLKELPPKRRQIIAIPPEKAARAVKEELEFYERHQAAIETAAALTSALQSVGDDESYKSAVNRLHESQKVMFTELARLRKNTGVAKIPYINEYLGNCLENEEKVFFFAHHRDVIDAVESNFNKVNNICVKHYGGMSVTEKQANVDRFENDPTCRLFNAGITTAVGYSCTKAKLGVGGEMDWRPAIMSQTEDRLHRIGQQLQEPVLIQNLVFDGSLDSRLAKTIIAKQEVIDAAIG